MAAQPPGPCRRAPLLGSSLRIRIRCRCRYQWRCLYLFRKPTAGNHVPPKPRKTVNCGQGAACRVQRQRDEGWGLPTVAVSASVPAGLSSMVTTRASPSGAHAETFSLSIVDPVGCAERQDLIGQVTARAKGATFLASIE